MNITIIIILVAAILLVAGAIIFVLVKGKRDNGSSDTSTVSPMTFQEQGTPAEEVPQEPQAFTPQLQTQETTTPIEAPVMQDLSTPSADLPQEPVMGQNLNQPMNTPVMQAQDVPMQTTDSSITQNSDLYQQAPTLPDTTQMTQDMSQFNQQVTQSAPDENVLQPNVPSQDQINGDMQSIMDALSTPTSDTTATVTPEVNQNPIESPAEPTMPDLNTTTLPTPDMGVGAAPSFDNTQPIPVSPLPGMNQPVLETPTMPTPPVTDTNTTIPTVPVQDMGTIPPMDTTQTPPPPPINL